ncbi:hypothetical protein GCM10007216_23260 [Thalassobacillus devorans]|uniref:LysM domain-containing protein n=1 Tax=Thalassobacillus devorans TaxID=279813 RepID=A0ABQ1P7J4_9BACI|nr:hypothetical protein [Thalassobacillus devorans]NIK29667.1 hypothetical protein [Thalassobacillus devorans]GGC91878.1 hypothetical protein GCM10007216_23260 [Thalassobacillus devorans]
MKKFGLFIFILLLLVSLYKDLTVGTTIVRPETEKKPASIEPPPPSQAEILDPPLRYEQQVPVKVKTGDTVLSIMEQLHNGDYHHSIEDMLHDFQQLNPGTEPSSLSIDKVYYFPLYENEQAER